LDSSIVLAATQQWHGAAWFLHQVTDNFPLLFTHWRTHFWLEVELLVFFHQCLQFLCFICYIWKQISH